MMSITKKMLLLIAALLLAAIAAAGQIAALPTAAQSGCCGYHRAGWYGQGTRAGFGPGAGLRVGAGTGGRFYNPETVTTVTGNVTAIEVAPARRRRAGGIHVTLSDANDTTTVARIGPAWFAQAEGLSFTKGDMVEITGSLVTVRGKAYLIARDVKKGDKVTKLRGPNGRPLWSARPW